MLACFMCPFGEIAMGGLGLIGGGLMMFAVLRHRAKAAVLRLVRGRKATAPVTSNTCGCDCPSCYSCDNK